MTPRACLPFAARLPRCASTMNDSGVLLPACPAEASALGIPPKAFIAASQSSYTRRNPKKPVRYIWFSHLRKSA